MRRRDLIKRWGLQALLMLVVLAGVAGLTERRLHATTCHAECAVNLDNGIFDSWDAFDECQSHWWNAYIYCESERMALLALAYGEFAWCMNQECPPIQTGGDNHLVPPDLDRMDHPLTEIRA